MDYFLTFVRRNYIKNHMIKWGILGAGGIAEKFASDFELVKGSSIVAVAARSKQRAESFVGDSESGQISGRGCMQQYRTVWECNLSDSTRGE